MIGWLRPALVVAALLALNLAVGASLVIASARPDPSQTTTTTTPRTPSRGDSNRGGIQVSTGGPTIYQFPRRPGDAVPIGSRGQPTPSRDVLVPAGQPTHEPVAPQQPPQQPVDSGSQLVLRPFGLLPPGPTGLTLYMASLAAFIGCGVVTVLLLPRRMVRLRTAIQSRPVQVLRLLAIGLVSAIAVVVLIVLLNILVVVQPISLLLITLGMVGLLAGAVAVALAIGSRLAGWMRLRRRWLFVDLVLGSLVVLPLALVPWAGWVLALVMASIGLGAVVLTRFGGEGWSSLQLIEHAA